MRMPLLCSILTLSIAKANDMIASACGTGDLVSAIFKIVAYCSPQETPCILGQLWPEIFIAAQLAVPSKS